LKVLRKEIEEFLRSEGWAVSRIASSHSVWRKPGALRPVVVDLNYADVPEDHQRTILKSMGRSRRDLRKFLGR